MGDETIGSPYIESQYPPDPATEPCDTTTGFLILHFSMLPE
jgi:hypothetical protein